MEKEYKVVKYVSECDTTDVTPEWETRETCLDILRQHTRNLDKYDMVHISGRFVSWVL